MIPVYFVAPFHQQLCNSIPLFHRIRFFPRKVVKGHHHNSSIIIVDNHQPSKDAYQMVCCEAGSVVQLQTPTGFGFCDDVAREMYSFSRGYLSTDCQVNIVSCCLCTASMGGCEHLLQFSDILPVYVHCHM